ncbi:MAG: divergent polysaccharide deacetylase family protein [Pseudomonadota bacterium]|nr:divergent polysaccharide deacetylase family protein [Pseudomonadota bacterium]
MTDELTRPLGMDAGGRQSRRLGLVAGLAALCLIATTAGWLYWLRLEAAGLETPRIALETAAPAPDAAPAPVSEPAPAPVRKDAVAPETAGNGLVELAPDGGIAPKVPLPEIRRQEPSLAHLPDPQLVERGSAGVIPKRSPDGLRPMDVYSRPPDTSGNFGVARVVLIVGGLGISQTSSQDAIRKLPGAVTLAFAPYGNSLSRWMQAARKSGHELLLQVPMEPFDYPRNDPGAHTLLADATPVENIANMHWAMSRITNYVGIMNFLGGKLVTSRESLKPVFDELARRGLLFVDDGSVKNSMTRETAEASILPYARAHIQIDAVRSRREIAARLDELAREARRSGLAIGVANAFPDSIDMIAAFARSASELGIEITPVSAVVSDPERKGD